MKDRVEENILKAERVVKKENGQILIKSSNTSIALEPKAGYHYKDGKLYALLEIDGFENPENYANPPILEGYKHVCGEWHNGFVIERCSDGSQFGWIPVGSLDSDGTLDGVNFSEKFGRRNYCNDEFSGVGFYEPLEGILLRQCESVKKYGGFYISRYNISINSQEKPQSIKGVRPKVELTFYDAKYLASTIEHNEMVTSHLTYGAEYDSVLAWFIKSNARNFKEIAEDSTNWGNYKKAGVILPRLCETGHSEDWCVNNLYDFAGNVVEWTQEQRWEDFHVLRGGDFSTFGRYYSVARRDYGRPLTSNIIYGCRAVLCIK